jgi:hypothetical protein
MKLNTILVYENGNLDILRSGEVGSLFSLPIYKVNQCLKSDKIFEDSINVDVSNTRNTNDSPHEEYSTKAYDRLLKIIEGTKYKVSYLKDSWATITKEK